MTGRHTASVLFWGGLVLWLIGGLVVIARGETHPWDGAMYLGSILMISGLYYQSVLKLKEQLREAEDKFQALAALTGAGTLNFLPHKTSLGAGDTCMLDFRARGGSLVLITSQNATTLEIH